MATNYKFFPIRSESRILDCFAIGTILLLFSVFYFLCPSSVLAYSSVDTDHLTPLDQANQVGNSMNDLIRSLFGSRNYSVPGVLNPSSFDQYIPKGYGLHFSDLIDAKSFSSQDISGSVKAVLVLFIKLIITVLSVVLGMLKALLDFFLAR